MEKISVELSQLESFLRSAPARIEHLEVRNYTQSALRVLPSGLGKLSSLVRLDVSRCKLKVLPDDLQDLSTLTEIDLQENALGALPDWLGGLGSLRRLDLRGNNLKHFPHQILPLDSLEELELSRNPLRRLPSDMSSLANLRILSLHAAGLSEFPEGVLSLRRLQIAYFGENNIPNLPEGIGALRSLEELYLHGNPLEGLPPDMSTLPLRVLTLCFAKHVTETPSLRGFLKLQRLTVTDCSVRTFPSELRDVESLTDLGLWGIPLGQVPDHIGEFSNLERLHLNECGLKTIPPSIGQLSKLTELHVNDNDLTEIPDQLGDLRELSRLNLSNNKLKKLPASLARLDPSIKINIELNPLQDPLPMLIERGTEHLFSYLKTIADARPQYEAKILLVGEGNVGKTSLVDALLGKDFIANRPTTHGIEIGVLELAHPREPVTMSLRTWDFGGQEVYRITHQFFFSPRSIYILVWRPREGQEENSVAGWCRRIRLRVGPTARILIVSTYCDERRAELDYPSLKKTFGDLLVGHWSVDNLTRTGIDELRTVIAVQAAELPQMGQLLAQSWVSARDLLKQRSSPTIARRDFIELCRTAGMTDESEIEAYAALLHDLGRIEYYPDDLGLRDVLVLQPEWLTKAIGYVLEDSRTREMGGILEHERLEEIWCRDGDSYPAVYHPYFLRLMEKFDVSYRVPDSDMSLVCQLVPYERPLVAWESSDVESEPGRHLSMICVLSDEAPGLIAWLTARNHRFSTDCHWRHGIYLLFEEYRSEALIEALTATEIRLDVRAPSPDYFFSLLRDSLEYLIRHRWRGLSYDLLIPCPSKFDNGAACGERFKLRHLVRYREQARSQIDCHECGLSFDVNELLTGFGRTETPMDILLDEVRQSTAKVQGTVIEGMSKVAAISADHAYGMRLALKLLSNEVDDCPRLFTLTPRFKTGLGRLRVWRDEFSLCLWCEEPGAEHPSDDNQYEVNVGKESIRKIVPYAAVVLRILSIALPAAGAAAPIAASDQATEKAIRDQLASMKGVVSSISIAPADDMGLDVTGQGMTVAEGEALRALRSLIFSLDPTRKFGGLRRVFSASGDYLWVCPTHYLNYDPGLPQLPYQTGLSEGQRQIQQAE